MDIAALCDRIDRLDRDIHAFVGEADRRGRLAKEAAANAARWSGERPPLYGAAVGVKDIIRADGTKTRGGSALPAEVFDGPQAVVVDRLRAAGALVAGKTVTAEFAVLAPGKTRNPHNLAHTPGGSSSGSAAAVAAGMVPYAVGTQTVGSVIRPAAFCGVVGFKPTFGRIPVDGVIPNAASFDTLGVFARDVAGVDLLAAAVCDGWEPGAWGTPVLGVPEGPYLGHAEPASLAAYERHAGLLRDAGYDVRRVPALTDFEDMRRDLLLVNRYELVRSHADWFPRYGDLYRPETVGAIREGQRITADEYAAAQQRRAATRRRLLDVMDSAGVDVWIAPPAPGPAPRGLATTGNSVMCLPWSDTGLPALTVPAGFAEGGLPLGLQAVAGPGRDEALVAWAYGLATAVA
ncbi:Glutamyl-tRNA(Gln) amidotransferase subunit A [Streptomyces sp. RB5]|uniref:Glutamyl-tRNA(Gln) amidotransferase subunit A n=1 Tax=Streptomyces smaragdinus TaxID=2585196 RepID=A0A7K0CEA7_9ACTN|nr:amidase [Streptomyces smaragdinus]MQY11706.1 Glutamyl-tRNA(Gln) amidotransferase subunit A [Streptomyces smaragdinus]